MGELFQNNHHKFGMSPNFAARWFEIDPTWTVVRGMAWLRIVKLPAQMQKMRWSPAMAPAATADAGVAAAAE
jgi:stearoyl-CoA desaturase (delta-9 desaturase)